MIVYLYRWKLKPGMDEVFASAWTFVTEELKTKCGSLGSRLHRGNDGWYYGYAQWPDKQMRDSANFATSLMKDALKRMKDASAESLPAVVLEPQIDSLDRRIIGTAPTIETPRLILRAHRVDDFADCFAMWSNPDVSRYIGGKPSTEQQTWSRILAYAGHWSLKEFGYWAVVEKASGHFIGEAGFADFKREISPSIAGIPELGWAFSPKFHGKGFASEAVESILSWGDAHFGPLKTVCIINPENVKSIKIAEKNGYQLATPTTYGDQPILLFVRNRDRA